MMDIKEFQLEQMQHFSNMIETFSNISKINAKLQDLMLQLDFQDQEIIKMFYQSLSAVSQATQSFTKSFYEYSRSHGIELDC